MFSILNFGLGTSIGSIITAVVTDLEKPTWGFAFGAIVGIIITVAGALTDPRLETNEYAQVKDYFYEKYEAEQREINPDVEPPRPNCCVLLGYKFRAVCSALGNPLILKFYAFLVL